MAASKEMSAQELSDFSAEYGVKLTDGGTIKFEKGKFVMSQVSGDGKPSSRELTAREQGRLLDFMQNAAALLAPGKATSENSPLNPKNAKISPGVKLASFNMSVLGKVDNTREMVTRTLDENDFLKLDDLLAAAKSKGAVQEEPEKSEVAEAETEKEGKKPLTLAVTPKRTQEYSLTQKIDPDAKFKLKLDKGEKGESVAAAEDTKKAGQLKAMKEDLLEILASNAKFDSYVETIDASEVGLGGRTKPSRMLDVEGTHKKRALAAEGALKAVLAGDAKAMAEFGIDAKAYSRLAQDFPALGLKALPEQPQVGEKKPGKKELLRA